MELVRLLFPIMGWGQAHSASGVGNLSTDNTTKKPRVCDRKTFVGWVLWPLTPDKGLHYIQ